jgi:hypothetical protein
LDTNRATETRILNALNTLREALTLLEWEPEPLKDARGFSVDFGPPHLPIANALAAIAAPVEHFVIYFNFGLETPTERRDEVARFVTRANWGLTAGNFELDYDDGQLRFRSSFAFTGMELTEPMILNSIRDAMNVVEIYADAAVNVIARGKSAEIAIKEIE